MKLKYDIKIKIKDIKIGDRYFSFKYKASINGKELHTYQVHSSNHSRCDRDVFAQELKDHYALELVLERFGNLEGVL